MHIASLVSFDFSPSISRNNRILKNRFIGGSNEPIKQLLVNVCANPYHSRSESSPHCPSGSPSTDTELGVAKRTSLGIGMSSNLSRPILDRPFGAAPSRAPGRSQYRSTDLPTICQRSTGRVPPYQIYIEHRSLVYLLLAVSLRASSGAPFDSIVHRFRSILLARSTAHNAERARYDDIGLYA